LRISSLVTLQGPIGQNVSNPFAMVRSPANCRLGYIAAILWRAASSNILSRLRGLLNKLEPPTMSISARCPTKPVKAASKLK
jgi:hypothetical protein